MRSLRFVAFLAIPAQVALGQQQPAATVRGTTLTLEEAIATARQNNPQLVQTQNNVRNLDAQVRTTYGALLPTASAGIGTTFNQGGTQYFNGVAIPGGSSDSYQSGYNVSLRYSIGAQALYAPRAARASRDAGQADVANTDEFVRATVTQQYIAVAQNEAQAAVLDSLVQTAQGQLDLVNAKLKVGAGTIIDVRTAEVALGQAQVNALTSHNSAQVAKLRLFQTLGVPANLNANLTTTFSISEPTFKLDELLTLAQRVNPDLAAKRSREYASQMGVRVAQANYLPSLSFSTGWGANAFGYTNSEILASKAQLNAAQGYTSCVSRDSLRTGAGLQPIGGCSSPTLTGAQLDAARAQNQPFKFSKAPYSLNASVSLPIFNGFAREQSVEQARVSRDNASYDVRARTLQITTDVTQAYLNLMTSVKTVELQTQIASKAAEDLALNEASFRVGAKTFLDVSTARATYEKAQIDRVNAIYQYQFNFAALENAVGRPLR
jgi:outer membrane protein